MALPQLPNLIVIGAMKCGTTSLHYYLSQHPDIFMSKIKELWFFNEQHNWSKGIDWYQSHFRSNAIIRGEASPGYTMYPSRQGIPKKMHAIIPDAKLIYIIRDPIARFASEYMHRFTGGLEDRSLEEVLACNLTYTKYLNKCRYYNQIEQFLPYYSTDKIHVLTTESLKNQRAESLANIFRFLGIDDQFVSSQFQKIKNNTSTKRRLKPIGRKIYHQLAEKHLNSYYPGPQRYLVKKLCFPFTQAVKPVKINDFWRAKITKDLSEDVKQLRQFLNNPLTEWSI